MYRFFNKSIRFLIHPYQNVKNFIKKSSGLILSSLSKLNLRVL
ncbi:hypothetical protein HMPREF9554_01627, partial [Treponema phagedenis F0421]